MIRKGLPFHQCVREGIRQDQHSTPNCRSKKMNREECYQEIESSIIVLGAAYAASLIGMMFWVIG